jgi:large subunit ribosomal protein L18
MKNHEARKRRKRSIRGKISGTAERPRLTVFRTAKHMYAQLVDDLSGTTIVAASTRSKELRGGEGPKTEAAKRVGTAIAEACKSKGIERVVFDRNGFLYHGRIKALADAARAAGLTF